MTTPDPLADSLVDRRVLRRKLTFWRVTAFLVAVVLVLFAGFKLGDHLAEGPLFGDQIARISISGLITGDDATLRLIREVRRDSSVKAVILSINSPGGTTSGAERIYDALRKLASHKPVVADVRDMAASGAYIAALGADHIVAQGNSLVGSIGVLVEFPNVSKLLNTVGVNMEEIKSSPLKAAPDGLTPSAPAAVAAMQNIVDDSFGWFKTLVQTRRHMSAAELSAVDDGRIFTGRQGLKLKLVDELGEEKVARVWLEKQKGVPPNLPVHTWKEPSSGGFHLFSAASRAASILGMDSLASALRQISLERDASNLDGLTSIWHPDSAH